MKKMLSFLLACALLCTMIPFGGVSVTAQTTTVPDTIKILCLGNSFAVDTMEHVANIAKSLGVKNVKLGTLYIGGCSINKHYNNAVNNNASYEYFVNTGSGWTSTYNHAIRATLQSEDWDWVSIQHGTGDGSRYAEQASYANLPNLIGYIKQYVPSTTKIAFNMTWVGEPGSHEELVNVYGNDTVKYYNNIAALTRDHIVPMTGIDRVSPTGTAIQNARTADLGILTRDNYHLSLNMGRYIAGLTFFKTLTGADISNIEWAPTNTTSYMKAAAIEAANNAVNTPFSVTASTIEVTPFEWPSYPTYGKAATPSDPYHAHVAKNAPAVSQKVDLLKSFQHGSTSSPPILQSTMQTGTSLGISLDLNKTPYLYYSFAVPAGSDFTFSIYSNSNYSPWFCYLDAGSGKNKFSTTAEEWDADFATRSQYTTTSATGCIDLREYAKNGSTQWIISQMKFYAPKGDSVIVSYFFAGSEAVASSVEDGENLLPKKESELSQADGYANITINDNGSLTLSRGADSAIAWPSVKYTCSHAVDLSQTPYLHLKMRTAGGCGNGFLAFTRADGTTSRMRLSEIVNGNTTDFTKDIDVYVDFSKVLGSTEVITLTNYTLSVYGVVGAELTWDVIAFAGDPTPPRLDGDVNNDGIVNTADATAIFRHVLGIHKMDDTTYLYADYNGDGNVSSSDVRKILMDLVNMTA